MKVTPSQLLREVREIEERLMRLQRGVGATLQRPGLGASDYGCCSDKGCCQDKGCCNDKKTPDPSYDDFLQLSEKLGLPVAVLVERIEKLDPALLEKR